MASLLRNIILFWCSSFSVFFSNFAEAQLSHCASIANSAVLERLCGSCDYLTEESLSSKDFCFAFEAGLGGPKLQTTHSQSYKRCCVLSDCKLGVDVRNCSISKSVIETQTELPITYIILDSADGCPGGDFLWKKISFVNATKICENKLDFCINVTCPKNSHCVADGKETECLCDEGWHGYRCLRYGTFPAKQWLCSMAAATLALTFGLWYFQHLSLRKLKKNAMMDSLVSATVTQNGPIETG